MTKGEGGACLLVGASSRPWPSRVAAGVGGSGLLALPASGAARVVQLASGVSVTVAPGWSVQTTTANTATIIHRKPAGAFSVLATGTVTATVSQAAQDPHHPVRPGSRAEAPALQHPAANLDRSRQLRPGEPAHLLGDCGRPASERSRGRIPELGDRERRVRRGDRTTILEGPAQEERQRDVQLAALRRLNARRSR